MTGAQLKRWRKRHNMTQKRAADWIGVSVRSWSNYEKTGPPMVLALLCTYKDRPATIPEWDPDLPSIEILPPATDGSRIQATVALIQGCAGYRESGGDDWLGPWLMEILDAS